MIKKLEINQLSSKENKVISASKEALNLSYSPYSGIKVGAAALLSDGTVVMGANQESPSYPVGLCAERSLIFSIMNNPDYNRHTVEILAISAQKEGKQMDISPCGVCRQTILDMENRQKSSIKTIFMYSEKYVVASSAQDLLPFSFSEI